MMLFDTITVWSPANGGPILELSPQAGEAYVEKENQAAGCEGVSAGSTEKKN